MFAGLLWITNNSTVFKDGWAAMSNKMPGCHLANAWRSRSKHILQWRYRNEVSVSIQFKFIVTPNPQPLSFCCVVYPPSSFFKIRILVLRTIQRVMNNYKHITWSFWCEQPCNIPKQLHLPNSKSQIKWCLAVLMSDILQFTWVGDWDDLLYVFFLNSSDNHSLFAGFAWANMCRYIDGN